MNNKNEENLINDGILIKEEIIKIKYNLENLSVMIKKFYKEELNINIKNLIEVVVKLDKCYDKVNEDIEFLKQIRINIEE